METQLSVRNLSVKFDTYDGTVNAVNNINLDIYPGETYGLVGETGCGKTVTALSVLRLVPPPGRIDEGSIMFQDDGEQVDLLTLREDEMRALRGSRISMIFQEPGSALDPIYTIGDQISESIMLHCRPELIGRVLGNLEGSGGKPGGVGSALEAPFRPVERSLYRRLSGNPDSALVRVIGRVPLVSRLLWRTRREATRMAVELMRAVDIPDPDRVVQQYPHELSGGMKQRSVIAMALACNPRFLIADEPTTALDVTIQAQILELLRKLKTDFNASILYITHDLAVAAELCDRIGVMYAGRIYEEASAEELYANTLHPYTQALMAAVPRPGQRPRAISGAVIDMMNLPVGCGFQARCSRVDEICYSGVPVMKELAPGHFVACHMCGG